MADRDKTPISFRWRADDQKAEYLTGQTPFDRSENLFGMEGEPATAAYPLSVRGHEFFHVGVLWGAHLIWRDGRWKVVPELCPGTDYARMRVRALKASKGKDSDKDLRVSVAQALRILLTRGTVSTQVWIEDAETRDHVKKVFEGSFGAA